MSDLAKNKKYKNIIIAVSIVIPLLVAFLNWGIKKQTNPNFDLTIFPKINAIINSAVAVLLVLGLYFIKKKEEKKHKITMATAFSLSILFLVSYVIYHSLAESVPFGGEGAIRKAYFFILLTHIVLAAVVMPFILYTFYFALTEQLHKHRKLAKYTWAVWFYVSITGVLVYLMISPYYV